MAASRAVAAERGALQEGTVREETPREGALPSEGGLEEAFAASGATVALLFLNLLDGVFTLLFLQLGLAEEVNPLMRLAYESSPMAFMALKLGIVHFGVYVLCLHREVRMSRLALRLGVLLYCAIVAYHLAFLVDLLLG